MRLEEGDFHVYAGAQDGPAYGEGPAPREPDARLVLDSEVWGLSAGGS